MFLLVSVRHVGAHPDDPNLGEGLCIFTSFHFPDSGLYLLNGFDFYFDLFWMAWHWKTAIREGPLEITGGGVTITKNIPARETCLKKSCERWYVKKKKILAEEATCLAFKVIKLKYGIRGKR